MIEHVPEDMTVTVDAETTLAALQQHVGTRGQWLPVDPPGAASLTIRALLNGNASGPRRYGYGTIREHLLGLEVRLGNGQVIRAGGKVVKNVAGYDLPKLFVGARGTLGTIREATFKLRPLPEAEAFRQRACESLAEAGHLIETLLEGETTPVVLDLHRPDRRPRVVVGFAGPREDVDWQVAQVAALGLAEPADLDYDQVLPRQASVLPSRLIEVIGRLSPEKFVARAGNGLIHYAGGQEPPRQEVPVELLRRVKAAYDPQGALPALWVETGG
jgi:FAD/FMN-containing dehydrogenase